MSRRSSSKSSGGWIEAVGPVLVFLVLMADGWLPRQQVATGADLKIFLLGAIAGIGCWAGMRSALASAALLAGASFYSEFFTSRDGSFQPQSWIHFGALLVAAVAVAVASGLPGSAGKDRQEEWMPSGPERSDEAIRRVDVVTGLPNRRLCLQLAQSEWDRWRRFATPFSVLIVEIDGFDAVRRSDSRLADSMLRVLANQMTKVMRSMDVAGRFEDGQFLVILPQTNYAGSLVAGEKLLKMARQTRMDGQGGDFGVTFSIGAAGVQRSDDQLKDLLQRASEAERQARASGGDTIIGDGVLQERSTAVR